MSTVNPYRAPQDPYGPASPMYAPSQHLLIVPFQSLQGLATGVKVLLGLVAAAKVAAIGATFLLISSLKGGEGFSGSEVQQAAVILGITVIGAVLLSLVAGIVYFVWLHRAYQNLPALGVTKLEASPGWAVGHYFIPIVNLFRPYQTIVEIMRGSFTREQHLSGKTSTAVVGWWWSGWILAAVLGQVSGALVRGDAYEPQMLGIAAWVDVAMHAVSLITAILAIVFVHRISNNQEQKSAEAPAQPQFDSSGYGQTFAPAGFAPAGLSVGNPFGEPPAAGSDYRPPTS